MPWWGWVLIGLALTGLGLLFYAWMRLWFRWADSHIELARARAAYEISRHRR